MTGVLMKGGGVNIDMRTGRTPCEHKGRDRCEVPTSQGMPEIAGKPPEFRERPGTGSSLQPSGGSSPVDAMILDLQSLEL